MVKYFFPNKLAINLHSINNSSYLYSITIKEYILLIDMLRKLNYKFLFARDFAEYKGENKICAITFDDGYKDNLLICDYMLKNDIPFTIFATSGFIKSNMSSFLSLYDLKELVNSGVVEIGSHTVSHCELKSINETDLKNELLNSRLFLSDATNQEIVSFAYPFGSYNKQILNFVKEYYKNAYSVYSSDKEDYKYSIPRLDINSVNIKKFRVLLRDIWRYKKCVM